MTSSHITKTKIGMASNCIPEWNLTRSKARSIASSLNLEYYNDDPSRLNIREAIHLIHPQATLGPDIPANLTKPPWKIPNKDKVNDVLNHSLSVQSATIPDTEFDTCVLTNSPLVISGLMRLYFQAIGEDCDLISGVLQFRKGPESDGAPHVWLSINDDYIDNSYTLLPKKSLFYHTKHVDLLSKEDLTNTKRKLFLGGKNSQNTLVLYKNYAKPVNVEKYLVACLRMEKLDPRPRLFDVMMRDFLQRKYKTNVVDLEEKWTLMCWKCFAVKEKAEELKSCSICKFAKYCGQECQKSDWKMHKILHFEVDCIVENAKLSR